MKRNQQNIEDLLERMGSQEHPGDPQHRYELRRQLLCSRFFEDCNRQSRWDRLFTYTAPLVAGGMMVGVLVVFAAAWPQDTATIQQQVASQPVAEASMELADITVDVTEFVSDAEAPTVRLADFEQQNQVRFVPMQRSQVVRTQ